MASYSVLIKEAPASMTLVREGFCMPALLFGPFWFVWRRAWLGGVLWLSGVGLIVAVGMALKLAPPLYLAAAFVFMWLMALEASGLRQRALMRRRFKFADIVEAGDRNEAEIRFATRETLTPVQPAEFRLRPSPRNGEAIGLFLNGT